jgi:hypothetical protein
MNRTGCAANELTAFLWAIRIEARSVFSRLSSIFLQTAAWSPLVISRSSRVHAPE